MKRAIIIVRTSTVRQEIDSQREEVIKYAISDGYTLDELEVIGDAGSSAIKLDARYLENINRVYNTIETTPSIECVYAWAIDRIGRREDLLMTFKQFLIDRRINLKVMNPSVSLLKKDGTVDSGMELAFSLFATMSKQEMEHKKERFKRAKTRNHNEGKFNGGIETRYGYSVDENGYFVVNVEEAEVVRLIYDEYATGNYSMQKLADELNERGVEHRGKKFNTAFLHYVLKDETYIGEGNKQAIVEKEVFDKVTNVRNKQASPLLTKETRAVHLAVKLLKCAECGSNYIANFDRYCCYKHRHARRFTDTCNNDLCIRINILDPLLWKVAQELHKQYLLVPDETRRKELTREIQIVNKKVETVGNNLQKVKEKIDRAVEMYSDLILTKEQFNKRIAKLNVENDYYGEQNELYRQKCKDLQALLDKVNNPDTDIDLNITDPVKQKEIVTQHIKKVTIERCQFEGKQMVKICINELEFIYNPNSKVKSQMNMYFNGEWFARA